MANRRIRAAAELNGVKLWEVAEALGITDSTLSRRLRRELDEDETRQMIAVIHKIAGVNGDEETRD